MNAKHPNFLLGCRPPEDCSLLGVMPCSLWCCTHVPWLLRQQAPLTHWYISTRLHGTASHQSAVFFIFTSVTASALPHLMK